MTTVSKKELAEIAGVSQPAISKLIRKGRLPVTEENRIDLDTPECRSYLESKISNVKPQSSPSQADLDKRSEILAKRRAAKKPKDLPKNKKQPVKPGTTSSDVMSRRELEMKKLAAEAQYKELKNAQIEERLVSRKVMILGVWKPLETFLVRILSDGAKTISKTVHPIVKSGGTREEVEIAVRAELTSFIVPLKESIQKALKLENV